MSNLKFIQLNITTVWKKALFVICILFGITVMLTMNNYTGFWEDEIFQAICVQRYSEAPLGLLVFYIGHLWTDILGFTILNLRLLVSLESILAISVTTCFLYQMTRNLPLSGFAFLLGSLLMKIAAFPLYNWDSGLYLFDAITICFLICIIDKPSKGKCIWLGVLIGIITLGRTPSVILLPLSIIIICMAHLQNIKQRSDVICNCVMVLVGWSACILFLTYIILGNPNAYVNAFIDGNVISGHSPLKDTHALFMRLLYIVKKTTMVWFPGIGCFALSLILPRLKNKILSCSILCIWLLFCILLAWAIVQDMFEPEFPLLHGGDVIIGIGLLISLPICQLFRKKKVTRILYIKLLGIVFLYLSMAFGSDGYIERMTPSFTIPLIIGLLWQLRWKRLNLFLRYLIGISILTFGSMLGCQFWRIKALLKDAPILQNGPFNGIKTYYYWDEVILKVTDAVNYLKQKGTRYTVLAYHHPMELVFGPNNGIYFQNFHVYIRKEEDWKKYKEQLVKDVDAFVYEKKAEFWDSEDVILRDLADEGFVNSMEIGEAVILYKDQQSSHCQVKNDPAPCVER